MDFRLVVPRLGVTLLSIVLIDVIAAGATSRNKPKGPFCLHTAFLLRSFENLREINSPRTLSN